MQYSLLYVVPNTLPVGDLVTEELHYQITDRQRIVSSNWISSLPSSPRNICNEQSFSVMYDNDDNICRKCNSKWNCNLYLNR